MIASATYRLPVIASALLISGTCTAQHPSVQDVLSAFTAGYAELDPEPFSLDFRERLAAVPSEEVLARQAAFFQDQRQRLTNVDTTRASADQVLLLDLALYEVNYQTDRIALERRWIQAGRPMPTPSVHTLPDHEAWYDLLVRRFTGYERTPADLMAFGEAEVARCHQEIRRLRDERAGRVDAEAWITDKAELLRRFAVIDSTVRAHLIGFVAAVDVPVVQAMEWPDAGPYTPPGIYLSKDDNAYGTAVFLFNFFEQRFDARALDWIYLHEAIPGHHLQWSLRHTRPAEDLRAHLLYPGNFEGWACYVEYQGRALGLYTDPLQELGKWEWDLVRSVRVVLDAGIHGLGWSREQALAYWEKHIPGKPALADREVTRVTNWPAQALSYKVGADGIQRLRDRLAEAHGPRFNAARFHRAFLDLGMVPLPIAEDQLAQRLTCAP
ncbi:MAG: DUF885 domain-containing protein [Flavobacteriales bacterium]|nr:hypothetical protein [Flavobacteriales bacterium]MCC6575835.1 DUF885 domain-containing protein [Flavobacteriales bacterium]NUQ13858.1 DUF885 domain-containing protein [Flavobacteriales bacterium]